MVACVSTLTRARAHGAIWWWESSLGQSCRSSFPRNKAQEASWSTVTEYMKTTGVDGLYLCKSSSWTYGKDRVALASLRPRLKSQLLGFTVMDILAQYTAQHCTSQLFLGTKLSQPPAIILDYMYGVSAYKCWRSRPGGDYIHNTMKSYQIEHYKNIPPPPPGPPT